MNPGFLLFGQQGFQTGAFGFWNYNEKLRLQHGFVRQPYHGPAVYGDSDSLNFPGDVAAIPGGFVEVGFGFDQPQESCQNGSCVGVFLFFFDSKGRKLHERVQVNEDSTAWEEFVLNNLAVDGAGNIMVTFQRTYGALPDVGTKAFVRRFSPTGVPLGPEIEVGAGLPGSQRYPVVAASPDGQFLVAWRNVPDPRTNFGLIYARRYGADGKPLGEAFRVSDPLLAQGDAKVAADRDGNYFVGWSSLQEYGYDARGRLYRHDGRPVTAGFRINQQASYDQLLGMVTFAPNGTLIVSYGTVNPEQTGEQVHVPVLRRYAASPGQEICAISGVKIRCDLGRTGDGTELQLNWGGRPEEVTLFGDVDGDGRDEVCAYFQGTFHCDISHEGTERWSEVLGSPGDVPLLADVDGDGLADPCLRRNNLLLCDTKRDGQLRSQTAFGLGGEEPLLGDLDGDHKADLCLVNGRTWDCLLTGGGQRHFQFGQRGASPALGDADRDGRADPCFLTTTGRLQCKTQHNGGTDYSLALNVPPGARLLFGNLDGL